MSQSFEPILPLVRAAAIEPAGCLRTALVMAELHDANCGVLKASMASLGALTGLSAQQVRKHVHSLIKLGVLDVTANAHGGAPGSVPHYQFDPFRLSALACRAGHTPDLFNGVPALRMTFFAEDTEDVRQQMAVELHGRPGSRSVEFFLDTPQGDIAFGWTPMETVLRPPFAKGAWTGWLNPQEGAPAWALPVFTSPETVGKVRQWVQSAALGRVESIETA